MKKSKIEKNIFIEELNITEKSMIARPMMLFFRAERGETNKEGEDAANRKVGQKTALLK